MNKKQKQKQKKKKKKKKEKGKEPNFKQTNLNNKEIKS